jgi:hypothetical protein
MNHHNSFSPWWEKAFTPQNLRFGRVKERRGNPSLIRSSPFEGEDFMSKYSESFDYTSGQPRVTSTS